MEIWQKMPDELREGFHGLPSYFTEGGWLARLSLTVYPIKEGEDALVIKGSGDVWEIGYREKIHFFRALGLLKEHLMDGEKLNCREKCPEVYTGGHFFEKAFLYREQMVIPEIGVMLDVSRNSVPKPQFLQMLLTRLALMGVNRLILYMEDVYQLDEELRFGYFRGGYTREELKALDDYAEQWGITIIPSIQVLGHLEKVLRYPEYRAATDSPSCLLVGEEETYRLIGKMLEAVKECFRSRMVIIGMDETHGLGQGRYREIHGDHPPMELFLEHLNRVSRMMDSMGLEPAYYSDMLFRYGSKEHTYLDPDMRLSRDMEEKLPASGHLIYWDYYSHDYDVLDGMMMAHARMGKTIYAGPLLSVSSFCVHYEATFRNASSALAAVKHRGIPMAYGCMWHDDGAECSDWLGLLGMQYYGEQAYNMEEPDQEMLARRFFYCTGLSAQGFLAAGMLDCVPCMNMDNRWPPNTGKYLLWQDPLMGLFDADIMGLGLEEHYEETARALSTALEAEGKDGWFLKVPQALAVVLKEKVELSGSLLLHYRKKDREGLMEDLKLIRELSKSIRYLHAIHREQWMACCAPFGWERMDLRYGGLLARFETADLRLQQFIDGRLDKIPELEEPRYLNDRVGDTLGKGIWKIYRNIASPSEEA